MTLALGAGLAVAPAPAHAGGRHEGRSGHGSGGDRDDDDGGCTPTPTATATATATPTSTPTATPAPTATPSLSTDLVWKDANGQTVPGIMPLTSTNPVAFVGLVYKDARGFFWHVDPWSLALSPVNLGQTPTIDRFYATTNCSGVAYIAPQYQSILPRVVFRVDGDPTYRAIPDAPTRSTVVLSSLDGGVGTACQPYSNTLVVEPLSETAPATPIVVPTVPFTAPIHLE